MATTETLSFDDAVLWAFSHTGHFTREPSKNLLLRLASAVTPQFRCVQWRSQHGEDITVTYNRDSETYTCEATPRAEPANWHCTGCGSDYNGNPEAHARQELRHARGIDG